jgi:acetoin utilization protein AcuB
MKKRTVGEIMSQPVVSVPPQLPADDAWSEMRRQGIRHLPVVEGGRLLGVLRASDLQGPHGGASRRMGRTARELMVRGVSTVGPAMTIQRAAALMCRSDVDCLPVVRRGTIEGIVTASDLLAQLARAK